MKFLTLNYICLQNPWLGGYHPQITVLSVLNWIFWTHPPPRTKFLGTPLNARLQNITLLLSNNLQCDVSNLRTTNMSPCYSSALWIPTVNNGYITKTQPHLKISGNLNFIVFFRLGKFPASEFYIPNFRKSLFHIHRQVGIKMEQNVPKRRDLNFRHRRITQKKHKTFRTQRKFEIKNLSFSYRHHRLYHSCQIISGADCRIYRGVDKSSARPGRKEARKYVREARDFNNIETRAPCIFFSCKARRRRKFTPFWQKH